MLYFLRLEGGTDNVVPPHLTLSKDGGKELVI
jgi:hypothetical protein